MEDPKELGDREEEGEADEHDQDAECRPKRKLPYLWWALGVTLLSVVGHIVLVLVPQATSNNWHYKLMTSLGITCTTLMWLGAVWLGGLLVYWQIVKSRR
jgi:hypothetical protein